MKKYLLFILFTFVLCANAEPVLSKTAVDSLNTRIQKSIQHDEWFSQDKAHHFMASAFITGFTYYAFKQELNQSDLNSSQAAVATSLSFGIGKEAFDKYSRKGHASVKDLVADLAGIVCGVLIIKATTE